MKVILLGEWSMDLVRIVTYERGGSESVLSHFGIYIFFILKTELVKLFNILKIVLKIVIKVDQCTSS